MKTIKRLLQFVTFTHRVHHYNYSYGWKIPFLRYGYFKRYGKRWGKSPFRYIGDRDLNGDLKYHNCTITGVY